MTNETEYQRGYREGAEKMREDAANNALPALEQAMAEIERLTDEVVHLGRITGTCVKRITGKPCGNCQCKKALSETTE